MPMGRPKLYTSAEEMQEVVDAYFADEDREVFTVESLCLALGMDRDTLLNYGKDDDFIGIVKDAKTRIHASQIEGAMTGKYNPTLSIFLLKNNAGYSDKQEITQETTAHTTVKVEIVEDERTS